MFDLHWRPSHWESRSTGAAQGGEETVTAHRSHPDTHMQLDFSPFFVACFSQSMPTDLGCNPRGVATIYVTFHLRRLHGLLCKQPRLSWAQQKALAQWPILGELHAEAGALPQQRCPTCCNDEQSILAFWEKCLSQKSPNLRGQSVAQSITSRSGGKAETYRKALSLSPGLAYLCLLLLTFGETLLLSEGRFLPNHLLYQSSKKLALE